MAKAERHSEEQQPASSEEYETGYGARNREEPMSIGATANWQAGWIDASRSLGSFADLFAPPQVLLPLNRTGKEARRHGLPFGTACSEVWKRDWIEIDIALGLSQTDVPVER